MLLTSVVIWKLILEFLSAKTINDSLVLKVYMQSNIAKYLPGNVMHYVGRNIMGAKLGWGQKEMVFSSGLEIFFGIFYSGLLVLCFFLTGLITIPYALNPNIDFKIQYLFVAIASLAVIILLIWLFRRKLKGVLDFIGENLLQLLSIKFLFLSYHIFLLVLANFLLTGMMFYFVSEYIAGYNLETKDFFNIITATMIGGFAGILTPGVPGGIGVKESASVFLVCLYGYDAGFIMLVNILLRIVMIGGEALGFYLTSFIKDKA